MAAEPPVRFNVNDAELRATFMRDTLPLALRDLDETDAPLWGKMSAQQMVEHLRWVFELSTGREHITCPIDEARQRFLRQFLRSNQPAPRNFMNPVLTRGLPAPRYGNLPDAKVALEVEAKRFLDAPTTGTERFVHPLFGPLDYEEWHRAHYKHIHHHLVQFALIESAAVPTSDDIPDPHN